jgi:hypothetical protein
MSASMQYSPKAAAQPKLRIVARHVADLYKSGISDETIRTERIFTSPSKFTKQLFKRPHGPGMVFQFGDGFFRIKLDRPQTDGKQYRQVKGSVNRIYVPWSLPNRDEVLADPTIPLIISEGEKKAIKACQDGLVAVSLTGVHAFLHKGEPIPDLDRIAGQGRTIVIIYDSDPSNQSKGQVDHARRWLASVLRERGADVWAVILPDDGETKVGLDDYLVAHSLDELLNLPVLRVPVYSSPISKKGEEAKYSVSANIERFLCRNLPSETDPEFLATLGEKFHSPFDRQRFKGTRVVRWRGEVRVKVNGQAKPWPAAVAYYHWLRWRHEPKGQAQMAPIRSTWLPVWQGLLEVAAGDRAVPEQYRTQLPEGLGETAQGTLDAWRTIEWIRSQRPWKDGEEEEKTNDSSTNQHLATICPCGCLQTLGVGRNGQPQKWASGECKTRFYRQTRSANNDSSTNKDLASHRVEEDGGTFFDPHVIAMLTGESLVDVLADWELLELHGYIDFLGGNRFVIGKDPISPQEWNDRMRSMQDDLGANKPPKTRPQFLGKNASVSHDAPTYSVALRSPPILTNKGENDGTPQEVIS